ncbi:hypothetical protein A11A3_04710 [Alcanivorax hongdengensis A-11-3]|uniref:Uncharacterized protein n=2 Tax=Alcanivorax hongdengensis TaxID=519051 RepID=L0WGG7_9GAMM|nr:hypothetical protein A11A3_04710 [Alcanivorax hongdengensis A-11-3]
MTPRFLGYVALFDSSDEILAFGGLDHPDEAGFRTDHPAWAHRFTSLEEMRSLRSADTIHPMALFDAGGRFVLRPTESVH